MVGAPAAADAVVRGRRLPELRVGLHLALVDANPVLPPAEIRALLRSDGQFDSNMLRAALRFFFSPQSRRQLAAEIRAQFAAFHATGLALDHVNAHKHMHLHPIVAALVVEIGREYGMKAVRLPSEPIETLRRAFPGEPYSPPLYGRWIRSLRRRLRRAGLFVNDNIFGLAWSGGMVEDRLFRLIAHLPDGVSEIYLHPATERTPELAAAMPEYRHQEEFAALLSTRLKTRIAELGIALVSYSDLVTAAGRM
jgi:chitin disaccharide deacetylase